MSAAVVPGAPVGPSAPLLARPLVPASCAAPALRAAAAGPLTRAEADAFAPGTAHYWLSSFAAVGKLGTALAALAILLGLGVLAAAACGACCRAGRRRWREHDGGVQGAVTQPWPGGLVLEGGGSSSAGPHLPHPPPPRSGGRPRAGRAALRCAAVAAALVAAVSASIGAARVSALTAAAVPDFWGAVAAAQAAAAVALYSAKGAVASLPDTAAGLEALSQALASANASTLLKAAAKVAPDGKAAAAGVASLTAKVTEAASQARAAEVGGREALARFDGSDGGPGGNGVGGLEAVAAFRERWQNRTIDAAPRVRAAGVGASLGLLAAASLVGGLLAAADPAARGVPLTVAFLLCLAAACSAFGGLAGVATARAAARDACLFAESMGADALVRAAGGGGQGDDESVITTIARFYLDTLPGSVDADEDGGPGPVSAQPLPPPHPSPAPPDGRGRAGEGALSPAPVRAGGFGDLPSQPALAPPTAPNLRLGGGRDAPDWAEKGGGTPAPPSAAAADPGRPAIFATEVEREGRAEGSDGHNRRRLRADDDAAAPPPPPPPPPPLPPPPPPGLATALGVDVSTLRSALADPTTMALLNTLSSGAGKALLGRSGLSPAEQAAAEGLPAAVEATAARLDAFEAASGRAAFRPALVALKRLPCCSADTALTAWGGAWVVGGLGAVAVAAASAVLGLWRGGRTDA